MNLENDYPRWPGESDKDYKARIKREYEIDHKYGISPQQKRERAESERFSSLSLWEQFLEKPVETLKNIGGALFFLAILLISIRECMA